jgi:two-component system OmpR family sensor kinase
MVLITAGSLLITTLVAAALMIQSYRTQDRRALTHEATGLASLLQDKDGIKARELKRTLAVLRRPLHLEQSAIVAVSAGGTIYHPQVLGSAQANPGVAGAIILAAAGDPGHAVSGVHGTRVYAAVGFKLDYLQETTPKQLLAVVVLTRDGPLGLGVVLPWLIVCLVAVLLVAVLVSWRLGLRLTRPLGEVGAVTARIAAGDLAARVDVGPDTDEELGALGVSVNAMAASLTQAQTAQRQFLLSVSHELRTPLTSIRGFAEALEDGAAPDIPRVGEIIGSEARRLDRLVSDLLDLARLDTGQFSLRPEPVPLGPALAATVEAFGPAAADLGLGLASDVADLGSVVVLADRDRLAQIVGNLIENAIKYASGAIDVGGAIQEGAPVIWVEDDGPGIAPDELPQVFTRLFSSRTRPGRQVGTGLGLAIVAELVAAMGANVRAESPSGPSGGSRFVVAWPAIP